MQLFEFVKGHSYQQFKLLAKMMFSWSAFTFRGSSVAALAEPNFWGEKKLMQNTPLIATLPTTVSPKWRGLKKKNKTVRAE